MDINKICYGCFREKNGPLCPYCGFSTVDEERPTIALPIAAILNGRYILGKVLGSGGFGITYLGYDLTLDVKVAIKEYLPAGLAVRHNDRYSVSVISSKEENNYSNGAERFLDEARILAKLHATPNIITVQNYFKENNTAYFVMEYVEGRSLKEFLQQQGGRIPYQQALSILLPIMAALSEVHAQSLLHRDISPDNIYICSNGQSLLLDFGAARSALGDEKSLSVILKHGYAPEEQYRSHGNQGPWTDVYAMGATLYFCITGALPPDSIERLHQDRLLPPSALGVTLPPYIEAAVMQALAVYSQNRLPNMNALIGALSGREQGRRLPVQALPPEIASVKTLPNIQASPTPLPGPVPQRVQPIPPQSAPVTPPGFHGAPVPGSSVSSPPVPLVATGIQPLLKTRLPWLIGIAALVIVTSLGTLLLLTKCKGSSDPQPPLHSLSAGTGPEAKTPASSSKFTSIATETAAAPLPETQGFKPFTHEQLNLTLEYPADMENRSDALSLLLARGESTVLFAHFNYARSNSAVYTLDDFLKNKDDIISADLGDLQIPSGFKIGEAVKVTLDGRDAWRVDVERPDKPNAQLQFFAVQAKDQQPGCYLLVFQQLKDDPDLALHEQQNQAMLQSFHQLGTPDSQQALCPIPSRKLRFVYNKSLNSGGMAAAADANFSFGTMALDGGDARSQVSLSCFSLDQSDAAVIDAQFKLDAKNGPVSGLVATTHYTYGGRSYQVKEYDYTDQNALKDQTLIHCVLASTEIDGQRCLVRAAFAPADEDKIVEAFFTTVISLSPAP